MKTILQNLLYLSLILSRIAAAEVVTDGTVGAVQSLSGQMQIPQSLGTTVGGNLFHSFSTFNINTGETATFSGDSALKNVISRVTGGTPSTIDGLLRSTIGQANFYFINPAGVTFGANASLDVPAAFYVSTADHLHFADGKNFSVSNPSASNLSIAEPASFGFLGTTNNSVTIAGAQLAMKTGQSLGISAGNIALLNNAKITAQAGNISVTAVGKNAASVTTTGVADVAKGIINIDTSLIGVSGNGSGQLTLQSGDMVANNSDLRANNTGSQHAKNTQGIDIKVKNLTFDNTKVVAKAKDVGNAGAVNIKSDNLSVLNSSSINTNTPNAGNAGNIDIQSHTITINNSSIYSDGSRNPKSTGNAGNITIKSDNLNLTQNGVISSDAWGSGNAGNITISSDSLNITQNGVISSDAWSSGNAGMVSIFNSGSLNISHLGVISSDAWSSGNAGKIIIKSHDIVMNTLGSIFSGANVKSSGNAGDINLDVTNLFLEGLASIGSITQPTATGNAGVITINSNAISILNGARISSDTYSQGNAGVITIHNTGKILIDRQNSSKDTGISTDTYTYSFRKPKTGGNAGNININTQQLVVLHDGEISSNTDTEGKAGNIVVNANDILIDGHDGIRYTSISTDASVTSTGDAGTVIVNSPNISIVDGGTISSSSHSLSTGNAGQVTVNADNISIDGRGNPLYTGIFSDSYANLNKNGVNVNRGHADKVSINAASLSLLNTGKISSSTWSYGKAGDVAIAAKQLTINGADTGIFAAAKLGSFGQSGEVIINADDVSILNRGQISIATKPLVPLAKLALITPTSLNIKVKSLQLSSGGQISAVSNGNVNAGVINLAIDNTLTANAYALISSSTFGAGSAGNINIKAAVIALDNAAISSAAAVTSQGQTGNVLVNANKAIYLSNHAKIGMQNDARIAHPETIVPTSVKVSAANISLKDSTITTAATGNVNAGDIELNFSQQLSLDPSFIITTATDGNGGTINVGGGELIHLQNSGFLTSVSGAKGNGGTINVSANTLVMDNGVIQANAVGGSGGDINLNLTTLISSQNSLIKGGAQVQWQPFQAGLNVIQAVSETGVSGNINVTSPQFNISGSISGLDSAKLVMPVIDSRGCQSSAMTTSALSRGGKGGIALNEAKTGFIPPAAPVALKTSNASLFTEKPLITEANLMPTSYPCATVSLGHSLKLR